MYEGLPSPHIKFEHNFQLFHTGTLNDNLRVAITSMAPLLDETTGEEIFPAVDHIKVVVKQIKGYDTAGFDDDMAGALTNSTVKAMKKLCTESVGTPNQIVERSKDPALGSIFIATNLSTGQKFQVCVVSIQEFIMLIIWLRFLLFLLKC